MNIGDILMMRMLMDAGEKGGADGFESKIHATDALKAFLGKPQHEFKEGDYIERNEYGRNVYKVPGKDQAAVVTKILDGGALDEQHAPADLQICVAVAKDQFVFMTVDSRYFKKANSDASNVAQFRRKD
jgi:hypothetical protein